MAEQAAAELVDDDELVVDETDGTVTEAEVAEPEVAENEVAEDDDAYDEIGDVVDVDEAVDVDDEAVAAVVAVAPRRSTGWHWSLI